MGGLCEVIVRAGLEPGDLIVYPRFGSEHNDRDMGQPWVFSQPLAHFIAVHIWHHDVEQDQVRVLALCLGQSLTSSGCGHDLIPLALQQKPNEFQTVQIIINHQYLFCHGWVPHAG